VKNSWLPALILLAAASLGGAILTADDNDFRLRRAASLDPPADAAAQDVLDDAAQACAQACLECLQDGSPPDEDELRRCLEACRDCEEACREMLSTDAAPPAP
jgi:hypothetical protein